MKSVIVLGVSLLLSLALAVSVQGQTREARLLVTVVDPSNAVIPNATVAVVGTDDTTKKMTIAPVKTSDRGIATVEHLPPGRYSVTAEFPGFELGLLRDLRLRAGDNKHVLVLPMKKLAEEITVGRDPQQAAADRAGTFGTALTREQVEALSDDPDEMRRQLQDMAGPGAAFRVDSFEGQQLPPKAQIKSIHITRDMFAAENHSAGGMFIDIITQPGMGPLRGQGRFGFYDSAMDGRNPLIPKKGPAQTRSLGMNIGGSLIKNRSSFSLSVSDSSAYRTPNLYAATLTGMRAENLNLRTPSNNIGISGLFDYAVTKDQTIRLSFSRYSSSIENQGVGAYDLIDRAYSTDSESYTVRIQEAGPLGRRFFINTRLYVGWSNSSSHSVTDEPTIIVNDAFTGGGAQKAGGRYTRNFSLQSDLDYVRGIQSWRTGVSLDGGRYRSDDAANYLGTYTFDSLAAFAAGLPRSYTRRLGDPNIAYTNVQAALYVQDDIRVRKNFTLSPGVRFEAQTHVRDTTNVGPRFGVTWAPFKAGKTTLRASAGVFYDWLSAGTYEQTLRVDGFHQQELNVVNPAYPDPGSFGVVPPTNRYLLAEDLVLAHNTRLSAGIDQQITKNLRIGATYANTRLDGVLVGENLNAPVNGVRPDPQFANIIQAVPDGQSRSQTLSVNANFNLSSLAMTMAGGATAGPRLSWRRGLSFFVSYGLARARNNTEGPFSVPASNSLATEWGPSSGDVRHRVNLAIYSGALKNLTASINLSAFSGAPYTIRTGLDDNGDLIFNDRPAGVGRNTQRAAMQWFSYGYFTYAIGIGKRTVPLGPGITISSSGGALSIGTMALPDAPRYRLLLSLSVQNLTNHANWIGYSGNMRSPFFLKPTGVDGVRTANLSVGFSF
jgi:hypothetical protein